MRHAHGPVTRDPTTRAGRLSALRGSILVTNEQRQRLSIPVDGPRLVREMQRRALSQANLATAAKLYPATVRKAMRGDAIAPSAYRKLMTALRNAAVLDDSEAALPDLVVRSDGESAA